MKLNKATYFSIFFLFCFLASFSTRTYQNLNVKYSKTNIISNKLTSVSSKEGGNYIKAEFIFEENENESENDFELHGFVLPFFISYFQYQLNPSQRISASPLAEKLTTPIFIEVCNFRI